ncbi:hypothetical protein, variant 3 [Verruconis gallopava]|nr:hypothetical protein, variant 1 [Verruconis gallopava]XP_016217087.1 hypothetical protein, variant 2 [Verruconis gallopava]XP_016217088.1 hypothetical protein, variant 3 [Verruconis gallopava]KIW07217.1 hypothetical protein, variant 1 [Verruconis gallopava]KIW07218.1 hypothetical protein, variant 2 [Verruconis gallopava]KIW07219.1 hypothetical protein, variant 3 [Verruconis gallopava]
MVVGAYYNSGYEIYAHERLAKLAGLTWRQIDFIKIGKKPSGEDELSESCSIAYDVAIELLEGSGRRGRLSDEMWDKAVEAFGKRGALCLAHYIGYYAYACMLMNAAGVGLPQSESIKKVEI